jgi:DNA-binding MarR family transcriptional regulator
VNEEYAKINDFLVNVFHEILRTEEASLKTKAFKNLSIREMHVIEAICELEKTDTNTASNIATAQNITSGTLATAINTLERKGYVKRKQDTKDKRVVRIYATERGVAANKIHSEFHHQMVSVIISILPPEDLAAFVKGLSAVQKFFKDSSTDGKTRPGL